MEGTRRASKPWRAFFVTFFTDKESKGGNPCGFQEHIIFPKTHSD